MMFRKFDLLIFDSANTDVKRARIVGLQNGIFTILLSCSMAIHHRPVL